MNTGIEFDSDANSATITWNSKPGRSYGLDFSTDFAPNPISEIVWSEVTDSILSQGDSTSFAETDLPAGAERRFYRVREE